MLWIAYSIITTKKPDYQAFTIFTVWGVLDSNQ